MFNSIRRAHEAHRQSMVSAAEENLTAPPPSLGATDPGVSAGRAIPRRAPMQSVLQAQLAAREQPPAASPAISIDALVQAEVERMIADMHWDMERHAHRMMAESRPLGDMSDRPWMGSLATPVSRHNVGGNQNVTPLPEAVANWYDPADQAAASQKWSAFSNEPHAQDFSYFLTRLDKTVNAATPQFKHATAEWLSHLADHPGLRHDSFVISGDAATNCEDRVSLCMNAMKNARLTSDVERGDYDHRLPELMSLAKGMFRLDQLEGIAREKTKSLPSTPRVDEVEVYLAYQVKLREPLDLPVDTADMAYFRTSGLSGQDLTDATTKVQTAERERFPDFLASQWQPWQSVLQRLAPERHAQTQDQLIEAMGEPFEQRLQQQLKARGLQNDPDAQREIGPQVAADIAREIKLPLTRNFLQERGLLPHIQPD